MAQFRLKDIFKGKEDELGLKQIVGEAGLTRATGSIHVEHWNNAGGFWERIAPHVILVISPPYVSGFIKIPSESSKKIFQSIILKHILCIVVCETETIPGPLLSFSELHRIPAFASAYDEFLLESRLCRLLREKIEYSISMHGTLVNVSGFGVLLTGDSGTGKTECALELVERGHRWVADDAVEVERRGDSLYGRSHELVKCLINTRSRGIVDAEELLCQQTMLDDSVINLIVELKKTDDDRGQGIYKEEKSRDIMGVKLPCMELPGFPETRKIYRHVELRVQKSMRDMGRSYS
ncbi:MAG TPA: hypothetical protein VFG29_13805 [Syntrophales bacterium]|nr:hypothetical protein [Syntrophales bacterium]